MQIEGEVIFVSSATHTTNKMETTRILSRSVRLNMYFPNSNQKEISNLM